MTNVVCLGCGRQRPYDPVARPSPGECPFCRDVSWTYLEDAERDPAGIALCIERRRFLRDTRELAFDVDAAIDAILGQPHAV